MLPVFVRHPESTDSIVTTAAPLTFPDAIMNGSATGKPLMGFFFFTNC
jgi:hypothetical protein